MRVKGVCFDLVERFVGNGEEVRGECGRHPGWGIGICYAVSEEGEDGWECWGDGEEGLGWGWGWRDEGWDGHGGLALGLMKLERRIYTC